jgi:hypothetical protein
MPQNNVVDEWEREAAQRVRAVAGERLRQLDPSALATTLGVMPSTASALMRTNQWTFPEAIIVANALGLTVNVTIVD